MTPPCCQVFKPAILEGYSKWVTLTIDAIVRAATGGGGGGVTALTMAVDCLTADIIRKNA